jgi:hypothetical protein
LQAFIGLSRGAPVDDNETRRPSCRSLDEPGQRPVRSQRGRPFLFERIFIIAQVFRNLESGACGIDAGNGRRFSVRSVPITFLWRRGGLNRIADS